MTFLVNNILQEIFNIMSTIISDCLARLSDAS